jgi:hypothetical protein
MLWICVLAALALSVHAFRVSPPRAALTGLLAAVIYLPFAAYLFANPGTRWLGPLAQLLYFAAIYPLHRGPRWAAVLLTAPAYLLAATVAYLALASNLALT